MGADGTVLASERVDFAAAVTPMQLALPAGARYLVVGARDPVPRRRPTKLLIKLPAPPVPPGAPP